MRPECGVNSRRILKLITAVNKPNRQDKTSSLFSCHAGDVPFCYYKALVTGKPSMRHLLSILRSIWVSGHWRAGN